MKNQHPVSADWIINELNINSVITSPTHDELVTLDSQKMYTLRGYAYSGEHHTTASSMQQV